MVTNSYNSGQIQPSINDSIVFTIPSFQHTQSSASSPGYISNAGCLNSPLYRAYTSLYDEVKLRGVSYEISVANPMGLGAQALPSFLIFASVDRRWTHSEAPPKPSQLANFASITPSSYVNYNKTKFKKYVSARDLIERTQYHDSTVEYVGDPYNYWRDVAVTQADKNPNFFCPALFFFVRFPFAPSAAMTLQFSVRTVFYLTFRNPAPFESVPAPPAAAAAAAESALPREFLEFTDDDPHPLSGSTAPLLTET